MIYIDKHFDFLMYLNLKSQIMQDLNLFEWFDANEIVILPNQKFSPLYFNITEASSKPRNTRHKNYFTLFTSFLCVFKILWNAPVTQLAHWVSVLARILIMFSLENFSALHFIYKKFFFLTLKAWTIFADQYDPGRKHRHSDRMVHQI